MNCCNAVPKDVTVCWSSFRCHLLGTPLREQAVIAKVPELYVHVAMCMKGFPAA